MLTESRKRQHSGCDETSQLVPQAKRPCRAHPLSPEPGRDAWDSESSNSESSGISSPELVAAGSSTNHSAADTSRGPAAPPGPCSPLSSTDSAEPVGPTNQASYDQINRILKEAHFQSLQSRGQLREPR